MEFVLLVGILIGLVILIVTKRRISTWTHLHARLTLLCFGIFGFLPAILLRVGALEMTAIAVIIAGAYFFIFSVIGSVILNGTLSRNSRL